VDEDKRMIDDLHKFGSNYLREYAYVHGVTVSKFMKKHGIGESEYGTIMDEAAKGKHVMAHRLYGHHPFYDFPVHDSNNIFNFAGHELSDLFTKQGLPILPGELLENHHILNYCKCLSNNWNFVNGFDILAGTIAIYQGANSLKKAYAMHSSLDTFEEVAHEVGIGAFELAIALSTCNPFLLVGAVLQLTASVRGIFNNGAVVIFTRRTDGISLSFSLATKSLDSSLQCLSIKDEHESMSIISSLGKNSLCKNAW